MIYDKPFKLVLILILTLKIMACSGESEEDSILGSSDNPSDELVSEEIVEGPSDDLDEELVEEAPMPPQNEVEEGTLVLEWDVPQELETGDDFPIAEILAYEVAYKQSSESEFTTFIEMGSESRVSITGINSEVAYDVKIAVIDINGNYSPYSDVISIVP